MPIQTTYPFVHGVGEEGLAYGVGPKEVITVWSDVDLYPGRVVCFPGTYEEDSMGRPKAVLASATGARVIGIVEKVRNEQLEGSVDFLTTVTSTQEMYYKAGTAVPVMIKGVLYVYAEEAVDPTDVPHFRFASKAGNTVLGRFRSDTDGTDPNETADPISAGAQFIKATSAAGLVPLRINFPQ